MKLKIDFSPIFYHLVNFYLHYGNSIGIFSAYTTQLPFFSWEIIYLASNDEKCNMRVHFTQEKYFPYEIIFLETISPNKHYLKRKTFFQLSQIIILWRIYSNTVAKIFSGVARKGKQKMH